MCVPSVQKPRGQDPVVQSIVSLTISLRHKFVKQISAKVTNTLLFFVEKNVRILCSAKDSHIFSTKNNSVFVILMFEILTETLTNDVVSFEQLGPGFVTFFIKQLPTNLYIIV